MDVVLSAAGLLALSPLLLLVSAAIWLEDRGTPFYVAPRVGRGGRPFRMIKLRSMVLHADRSGVDSTAQDDPRITRAGQLIRKLKLDELSQLWNVLRGDMSLVGPRPNVARDVDLYTSLERHLLSVKPGVTDFASIVFADEGEILAGAADPDLRYHQLIRPWKSRLGLHYVASRRLGLDIGLIAATLVNGFWRQGALRWVGRLLRQTGADPELVAVARRETPLVAAPPPGASEIVENRAPRSRDVVRVAGPEP